MKKYIILLLIYPIIGLSSSNIFDNMDEKMAVTTGISKLSEKEKKALAHWLKNSKKEIIKKEKVKNMGFKEQESDRSEIHSSVVGAFSGWKGKTVFKLENGQVWKQLDGSAFYVPKKQNRTVTIKPKSFGSWTFFVDGYSRGVKVKRIK